MTRLGEPALSSSAELTPGAIPGVASPGGDPLGCWDGVMEARCGVFGLSCWSEALCCEHVRPSLWVCLREGPRVGLGTDL